MDTEYDLSRNQFFKDIDLTWHTDSLTGVLNREAVEMYVKWLINERKNFSFFLVDIDNFKNVNDTYGHMVGDTVIQQTAHHLIKNSGDNAVVGRYGGDEFIIIFDGVTEYNDVWKTAHEVLNINAKGFEKDGTPNLTVTVTAGISRCPTDGNSYEELLNYSDKALYRGKTKGRNCFIIYLPEKHANISLKDEKDKRLSLMQRCTKVFNGLTAGGEDISAAVSNAFRGLIISNMFEHICLESPTKMSNSVVYTLSEQKSFEHIPKPLIDKIVNADGYVSINQTESFLAHIEELDAAFKKQKLKSVLFARISAYNKDYGYIRVDTSNSSRIWQNDEVSLVIIAAKALGLLLYYQNKTLDDLPAVAQTEVGKND